MGGHGSTRWNLHTKKTQVEKCRKITIYAIRPFLQSGFVGFMSWKQGIREMGNIVFRVAGGEIPEKIRLVYTISDRDSGEKKDCDYFIQLETTPLPGGGIRYWFICPLSINNLPCQRRVGALYLPPRGRYFGCRQCHNLTYKSTQEKGLFGDFYKSIAVSMQGSYTGITVTEMKFILDEEYGKSLKELYGKRFKGNFPKGYLSSNRYTRFVTAGELCQQSGLSRDDLSELESARLLLPDTKDERYRPKLVGWARKLKYLLDEGWDLDEIKRWSKERWSSPNPRTFPPKRNNLQE